MEGNKPVAGLRIDKLQTRNPMKKCGESKETSKTGVPYAKCEISVTEENGQQTTCPAICVMAVRHTSKLNYKKDSNLDARYLLKNLSPSEDLLSWYTQEKEAGRLNQEEFDNVFVPQFLYDFMQNSHGEQETLKSLADLSKTNLVSIEGFETEENLSGRSVLAGICQYYGMQIDGAEEDYSRYGKQLNDMIKDREAGKTFVPPLTCMKKDISHVSKTEKKPGKKSVMITGHRPGSHLGKDYPYPDSQTGLYDEHSKWTGFKEKCKNILRHEGATEAITGMALGADTVFAQAVLEMKDEGDNIRLVCALPCWNYDSKWTPGAKKMYKDIINSADEVHYTFDGEYKPDVLNQRNDYMANRCDEAIALWDRENKGGTARTVDNLESQNKTVFVIIPETQEIEKNAKPQTKIYEGGEISFDSWDDPKYGMLSNYSYVHNGFEYDGIKYTTAEAAFQAAKTDDTAEREKIAKMNPGEAKKEGHTVELRPDWEDIKYDVMKDILRAKFQADPKARHQLLSTYGKTIISDTTKQNDHDNTWGKCSCPYCMRTGRTADAENLLGKALMEVRTELQEQKGMKIIPKEQQTHYKKRVSQAKEMENRIQQNTDSQTTHVLGEE